MANILAPYLDLVINEVHVSAQDNTSLRHVARFFCTSPSGVLALDLRELEAPRPAGLQLSGAACAARMLLRLMQGLDVA